MSEWKQRLNKDLLILFQPPERAKTSVAPSVDIRLSALGAGLSDVTQALSLFRSSAMGTVCDDLHTIYMNSAPTSPSIVGEASGRAFINATGVGGAWAPITVAAIDGQELRLGYPLDESWDGMTVTVHWNIWTATVTDATLKGTVRRSIPVEVSYTEDGGTGGTDVEYVADRLLHVVRRPFDTRLQDAQVFRLLQGLEVMRPSTQDGYAPQRAAALEELVAMIRAEGLCEDYATGTELTMVHAYLTAAIVLRGMGALGEDGRDASAAFLARAEHLFKKRLKKLDWYDTDDDGEVDAGESGLQVTGAKGGVSYRGGKTVANRTFSVGMKH